MASMDFLEPNTHLNPQLRLHSWWGGEISSSIARYKLCAYSYRRMALGDIHREHAADTVIVSIEIDKADGAPLKSTLPNIRQDIRAGVTTALSSNRSRLHGTYVSVTPFVDLKSRSLFWIYIFSYPPVPVYAKGHSRSLTPPFLCYLFYIAARCLLAEVLLVFKCWHWYLIGRKFQ